MNTIAHTSPGVRPADLSVARVLSARTSRPVHLPGAMSDWPAVSRWTRSFLAGLGGDLPVRLVYGNREQGRARFVESTFADFCLQDGDEPLYLKEFDLLQQFPELRADVDLSEFARPFTQLHSNAWIGSAGSSTGMHYDLFDNFLCHVSGKKTLYLLDKRFTPALPRNPKFDAYARLGTLDLSAPGGVPGLDAHTLRSAVQVLHLQPGDAIFIPAGWWHQVANHSFSISISGFRVGPRALLSAGIWEGLRKALHDIGLYKRGNCTCHEPRTSAM